MTTGARLELVERKPKGAGAVNEPVVIAGERYGLSLLLEKVNRRQMKGIQHSNRLWKGLQCPRQHGRSELYQRQPTEQRADFIRVRSRQFARVNSRPNLVLDQPSRDQRFLPEAFRWGRGLRPKDAPARPKYRDKSTVAPVLLEFLLDFAERGDGFSRRGSG